MRRKLIIVDYLLYCSFLFHLSSCQPAPPPSFQTTFLLYRFNPPAFVEFSGDFQIINEIPFSIPPQCGLNNTFPAPIGRFLAIELNCPNGQMVLFLDTDSTFISQPITDADSHFLSWAPGGQSAYLKVDSLGNTRVIRMDTDGKQEEVEISPWTYDLAVSHDSGDFTITFSRGLGYGSEMHLVKNRSRSARQLHADSNNYISFARFSPDGEQIAFIKIPDSSTPFTVGELWVMNSDGSKARKLADADAGHGYAANWSPDGKRIAFVVRENPEDEEANQSSDSLISNIYIVEVESGKLTQITHLQKGHAETPSWSPDGNTLAFNMVVDGRMEVRIADIATGEIRSLITESTCCPAWMRK